MTSAQQKALRSILALVFVGLLTGAALWRNRPTAKELSFNVSCTTFIPAVPLVLDLHRGESELQSFTAEEFQGAVENVEAGTVQLNRGSGVKLNAPGRIPLAVSPDPQQTPPHLEATRRGGTGKLSMTTSPGVSLSSSGRPGASPQLNAADPRPGAIQLLLTSGEFSLAGNRYLLPDLTGKGQPEDFTAQLSGQRPGVVLSLSGAGPKAAVNLRFRPYSGELQLCGSADHTAVCAEAAQKLELHGALNADLRIEKKTVGGMILDHPVDLLIDAETARIDEILIIADPEKRGAPTLRVRGSATVTSLKQDGRELLNTFIAELMDKPYAERSGTLAVLGFALFAMLKIVDRTLGVLVDYLFPEVH